MGARIENGLSQSPWEQGRQSTPCARAHGVTEERFCQTVVVILAQQNNISLYEQ
jgi:hypothetical protein